MAHQDETFNYVAEYKSLNLLINITSKNFVFSKDQIMNKSKDYIVTFFSSGMVSHYNKKVDELLLLSKNLRKDIWPDSMLPYKKELEDNFLFLINQILDTVKLFKEVQVERSIAIRYDYPRKKYKLPTYDGSIVPIHFYQYWACIEKLQDSGLHDREIIQLIMTSLTGRAKTKFDLISEDKISLEIIKTTMQSWFGDQTTILSQIVLEIQGYGTISSDDDVEIIQKCTKIYKVLHKLTALFKATGPESMLINHHTVGKALLFLLPRSERDNFSNKINEPDSNVIPVFTKILKNIEKQAEENYEYNAAKTGAFKSLNEIQDCYYKEETSNNYLTETLDSDSSDEEGSYTENDENEDEDESYAGHVNVAHNSQHKTSHTEDQYEDGSDGEVESEYNPDGSEEADSSKVEESEGEMETELNETDVESSIGEGEHEEDCDDKNDPDWEDISVASSSEED